MLQPLQVPLIFWAFAMLGHSPAPAVLLALEARVRSLSSHLTAQVVTEAPFIGLSQDSRRSLLTRQRGGQQGACCSPPSEDTCAQQRPHAHSAPQPEKVACSC